MDPTRTTDALGSDYPDHLCVVQSNYELRDVRAAEAAAMALLPSRQSGPNPFGVTAVGLSIGADAQPVVEVDAVFDNPELRDALESQPAGLVRIVSWLQPTSG